VPEAIQLGRVKSANGTVVVDWASVGRQDMAIAPQANATRSTEEHFMATGSC
jgi:hypothetical protein